MQREDYIKKIDQTLNFINQAEGNPMSHEIEGGLRNLDIDIKTKELSEILLRLEQDKNCIMLPGQHNNKHYYSTFNGQLHAISGGYRESFERAESDKNRTKMLEDNQLKLLNAQSSMMERQTKMIAVQVDLQGKIVNLTKWITIATVIAGVAAATQIIPWVNYLRFLITRSN